jgi:dCTP deaminase
MWFDNRPLISPFCESVQEGISYGLTSAGYDARLDDQVLVYKTTRWEPVDPKRFKDAEYRSQMFDEYKANYWQANLVGAPNRIILPGGTYALVQTMEEFCLPRHLKGRCVGKSTYARCGLIVNTTPLEPEWYGKLTIEVFASVPVVLYVGEGICQMEFERTEGACEVSYADKKGKYQGQQVVTPPRTK